MNISYDHLGYGQCWGHWIRKPQIPGQKWIVLNGTHPHDPDGYNDVVARLDSEKECIEIAKIERVKQLQHELAKIDASQGKTDE